MNTNDSALGEITVESLVCTEHGQKLIGELMATENLWSEVQQHLDLLDVPDSVRKIITDTANVKAAAMAEKDVDARNLLSDAEPVLARITGSALSVAAETSHAVTRETPSSSAPHIG